MNPALRRLGYGAKDRVVIVHLDDVGMSHATLSALNDLLEAGLVSSASVMAPCQWFPAAVAWHREHPSADVGLHLTLTSEREACRWGPISTCHPECGLTGPEGYFHATRAELLNHADPDCVYNEMKAQIARAITAGMKPTHLDSHMFAGLQPRFISQYTRLGLELGLPVLLMRRGSPLWEWDDATLTLVEQLEGRLPVFDGLAVLDWTGPIGDREAEAKKAFDGLPAGLSCFLVHAAADTPELREMTPYWRHLAADLAVFQSGELIAHVRRSGIQVITYRALSQVTSSESHA